MDHNAPCGPPDLFQSRLDYWLSRSPGRELVERERLCVTRLVADLFGYYLLQVGWSRHFGDCVAHSRVRHHVALESVTPGVGCGMSMFGNAHAFPVAGDSMDVVFLPHTLDFARDPHQVLREAERVLIPEGRLILIGFNPWSPWGLWRVLGHRGRGIPWCARFLGARRVMDWLTLRGFMVECQMPIMFLPPVPGARALRQFARLEPLGRRWLPMLSGAYAVRAVKRVSRLTPIVPPWKVKSRLLAGRAVEPSVREGPHG